MSITKLRYQGNGATRGHIVARDFDGGEVSGMSPDQVSGMVGSGLWAAERDDEEPEPEAPVSDLMALTKVQLVALADEEGAEIDPKANKPEIVAAIEAHRA